MAFGTIGTVGGSAAGVWSNTPEAASFDGLLSLEKQDSAPSHTSGYVKLYTKEVAGGSGAELLLHLNDNVTDEEGNTCTASHLGSYVDSDAGGDGTSDSGFGKAAVFEPGGAGVGGTDHSRIAVPDLGLNTGDFTIEWWSYFDTTPNGTRRHCPWSFLISGTSTYVYLAYFNANEFFISDWASSAYFSSTAYMTRGSGGPKYSHWVVTRKSNGDGTSTYGMFHHGTKLTLASGTDTWTTKDLTTMDIGRLTGVSDASYNWGHEGKIDEFAVYSSVLSQYDGTSSYTVPTSPISGGAGGTELFVKDSAGNETQIS